MVTSQLPHHSSIVPVIISLTICSVPRWLRAGMAIGRRAQNARNIRAKLVNYRTLINVIVRSQYLTV